MECRWGRPGTSASRCSLGSPCPSSCVFSLLFLLRSKTHSCPSAEQFGQVLILPAYLLPTSAMGLPFPPRQLTEVFLPPTAPQNKDPESNHWLLLLLSTLTIKRERRKRGEHSLGGSHCHGPENFAKSRGRGMDVWLWPGPLGPKVLIEALFPPLGTLENLGCSLDLDP